MSDTVTKLFEDAEKATKMAADVIRFHELESGTISVAVIKDNMNDAGWIVRVVGESAYLVELDDSLTEFTLFQVSHRGSAVV